MQSIASLAFGLSLLSAAKAQTSTSCNPTEKTCPSDAGLDQSSYSVDFTQGASSDWNMTYGSVAYDATNGANFTIAASGDAPTMQSNWYIFFGEVSVEMRTAPGTGIVSCAILESDDLDEIDWEWLGGTAGQVETNYFGKGNTTTYDRETYVDMADSQSEFHNYTVVWTKESLTWKIDGATVRTLAYADALAGDNYPQTPMRVKLGIWAGGDSSNSAGTIAWAGGATDYSDGPFTAYIKSVSIVNYNPAGTYTYGDTSGSYDSIELGDSTSSTSTSSTSSSGSSSSSSGSNSSSGSDSSSSSSGSTTTSSGTIGGASLMNGTSVSGTNSSTVPAVSGSNSSTSTGSSSASSSTSTAVTASAAGGALWSPRTLGTSALVAIFGGALLMV